MRGVAPVGKTARGKHSRPRTSRGGTPSAQHKKKLREKNKKRRFNLSS